MASYVVMFKDTATDEAKQQVYTHLEQQGAKITNRYTIIPGFSCELPETAVEFLKANQSVASVEADGQVTTCT